MRRVCGMDVQCHLMNLYAIYMSKYLYLDKKKRITKKLSALINHIYALLAGWRWLTRPTICAQTPALYARSGASSASTGR
ncbi:hypothetical protein EKN30_02825 [Enterobacter asburiae]|nr:hypothetical protein CIG53_02790 [Enterobacter asburiae]QBB04349.1 hypothetical protein EVV94_04935 [Enterobacter cloacae]RAY97508.1 hypothetical protein DP195_04895 [Enterobacter asburiae]RTP84198.1 hypothetical protein EKN33_01470 [Enterobacter asburiae]RTP98524.1 hypothetical protein EKN30_02825 [Enterobacter asburiae]